MTLSTPPEWLQDASTTWVQYAAPWVYFELTLAHVVIYFVLRWQRNPHESQAARWLRPFIAAKGFLWGSLLIGRLWFPAWLTVNYAAGVIYVALATTALVVAMVITYAVPAWRCRGGRCGTKRPPIDDMVPMSAYQGQDRRSGLERRAGWRTSKESR